MAWEAIHCDRPVESETITTVVAEVLGVSHNDLSVAAKIEKARVDAAVMVAIRERGGEFPVSIDIIAGDERIGDKLNRNALKAMCKRWGCRALINGDSDSPYRMVLLDPERKDQSVYVDPTALDDHDELIVRGPTSEAAPLVIPTPPPSARRLTPPPPKNNPEN